MMKNTVVMPYRIYSFFADCPLTIVTDPSLREDEVLLIDNSGHVHSFTWNGRIIDDPPPQETDE